MMNSKVISDPDDIMWTISDNGNELVIQFPFLLQINPQIMGYKLSQIDIINPESNDHCDLVDTMLGIKIFVPLGENSSKFLNTLKKDKRYSHIFKVNKKSIVQVWSDERIQYHYLHLKSTKENLVLMIKKRLFNGYI